MYNLTNLVIHYEKGSVGFIDISILNIEINMTQYKTNIQFFIKCSNENYDNSKNIKKFPSNNVKKNYLLTFSSLEP